MPNPAIIHPQSTKLMHYLAVADFFIRCGRPDVYEVEPNIDPSYRPDAYTIINDEHIVVEVQRSHISNRKMQDKIDAFVDTQLRGKHQSRVMWIVTDERFHVTAPNGFNLRFIPLKQGVLEVI